MSAHDRVIKRVLRRRRGRRPARVVDQIKADDGPEFQALLKPIRELGFGKAPFEKRSVTFDVAESR
jgi:hypothetical protein